MNLRCALLLLYVIFSTTKSPAETNHSLHKLTKESCLVNEKIVKEDLLEGKVLSGRCDWLPYDSPSSSFTDPHEHDPKHFQYLIHVPSTFDELHPQLMKTSLLSTSVINQDHRYLYGNNKCALILYVNPESIYVAAHDDVGLQNNVVSVNKTFLKKHGFDEHMSDATILEKLKEMETSNPEKDLKMVRSIFKWGNQVPSHLSDLFEKWGILSPKEVSRKKNDRINEIVVYGDHHKAENPIRIDGVACYKDAEDLLDKQDFAFEEKIPFVILERNFQNGAGGQKESSETLLTKSIPIQDGKNFDPFTKEYKAKFFRRVNFDIEKGEGRLSSDLSYRFSDKSIESMKSTILFLIISNAKGETLNLVAKKFPKVTWLIEDFQTFAKVPKHLHIPV